MVPVMVAALKASRVGYVPDHHGYYLNRERKVVTYDPGGVASGNLSRRPE